MTVLQPELEIVPENEECVVYLEHGWPTPLCRWHSHKECELHLLTSLSGRSYVGDHIGNFKAGDLFLTGPYLPHNWITDEIWSEPVELRDMMIQFDGEKLLQLIDLYPEFEPVREMLSDAASGLEFVNFDFELSKQSLADIRDKSGMERALAFLGFLSQIAKHDKRRILSVQKIRHGNRSKKQVRICDVVDHIVTNYADPINVSAAAEMAGMSPSTFSRNFQTVTGNKFVEFINRVRIGQACSLLYSTDKQITTICYQVGFQNLANFNRHFLKMKGMTPSEYRRTALRELATNTQSIDA